VVSTVLIARSKRDGTRAETRFGLWAKRTSPFKSAGVSVQSTTGSQGAWISGQQLYRPCSDVQCEAAGYPLHSHLSPSLPLPCVAVCHQVPNALYHHNVFIIRIRLHVHSITALCDSSQLTEHPAFQLVRCHVRPLFISHTFSPLAVAAKGRSYCVGHTLAQAVNSQHLTVEAWVWSQANARNICGGWSGKGGSFSPSTSVFSPVSFYPCFILIHSSITDT